MTDHKRPRFKDGGEDGTGDPGSCAISSAEATGSTFRAKNTPDALIAGRSSMPKTLGPGHLI